MRKYVSTLALVLTFPLANVPALGDECSSPGQAQIETTWVKGDRRDFEEAAAGFSVAFNGKYGPGNVYVYHAGISDWSEGVSDSRLAGQMEDVIAGVKELVRRGTYTDVVFTQPVNRKFACQDFMFVTFSGKRDGHPMQSTTAIAVQGGKVVKFRATFYGEPQRGIDAETEALIQAARASGVVE